MFYFITSISEHSVEGLIKCLSLEQPDKKALVLDSNKYEDMFFSQISYQQNCQKMNNKYHNTPHSVKPAWNSFKVEGIIDQHCTSRILE